MNSIQQMVCEFCISWARVTPVRVGEELHTGFRCSAFRCQHRSEVRRRWLAYNNPGGYHRFRFVQLKNSSIQHRGRGRGRGKQYGASVTTEGTKVRIFFLLPDGRVARPLPVQVTGGEASDPWVAGGNCFSCKVNDHLRVKG